MLRVLALYSRGKSIVVNVSNLNTTIKLNYYTAKVLTFILSALLVVETMVKFVLAIYITIKANSEYYLFICFLV
jgi:hypothetical protein